MDVIQELDEDISKAQSLVDMGNALERLLNNPDFKLVIMKGFFETEAIRLVQLKADPNTQSKKLQNKIIKQIDGVGYFRQHLQSIGQQADMAKEAINAAEITRQEILEESLHK